MTEVPILPSYVHVDIHTLFRSKRETVIGKDGCIPLRFLKLHDDAHNVWFVDVNENIWLLGNFSIRKYCREQEPKNRCFKIRIDNWGYSFTGNTTHRISHDYEVLENLGIRDGYE